MYRIVLKFESLILGLHTLEPEKIRESGSNVHWSDSDRTSIPNFLKIIISKIQKSKNELCI